MATELIDVDGQRVLTLKEMIRPKLRAILVGINPSPVSVAAEHYYQGRLGKLLWRRLHAHDILPEPVRAGREDDDAFSQGFGLADVVRRPSASAKTLGRDELERGAADLVARLTALPDRPLIIFVFAGAAVVADALLRDQGFATVTMPGPYAKREEAAARLDQIAAMLDERS